jgi:hypothetical protein
MKRMLLSFMAGVLTIGGLAFATVPASAQTIANPPLVVQTPVVQPVIVQPQIVQPVIVGRARVHRPVYYRHYAVRRGWRWHRR